MSVARRLIGSFGATILGPAITILVQIINVPVMLRFWGPQLYGEWLLLTAMPTYLLLTDMGFGSVAGSDMTMRVSAGDTEGAIETFQSTQALVLLSTVAISIVLAAFFIFVPIYQVLHLSALSPSETQSTLFLLSINCLVILQWSTIMAGYRSTGRYALGMLYTNCIRIVEGASFFIVLFTKSRPPQLAALMLLISILGTTWLVFQHHRRSPWLAFGFQSASWTRIKELSSPAFAFMAFPICAAISTQGMTLVVGLYLGPIAVAVFNPMRTFSRVPLQLGDAIKNSVWPELSTAFGNGDLNLARRLHRSAFQASMILGGGVVLLLFFLGPRGFLFWTHGHLHFDAAVFDILLLVVLANTAWNSSSSVAMSANRHERMSLIYLTLSVISIIVACLLLPRIGLRGPAIAMLFADLGMSIAVVRISNGLLSDPPLNFIQAIFDLTALKKSLFRIIGSFVAMESNS